MISTAALQSEQASGGVYIHHYAYYRKDGKPVSLFAPSGVDEPTFKQINSVCFENENEFLRSYFDCSGALPIITEKLQDRKVSCGQNEEDTAFKTICEAFQSLVPSSEVADFSKGTLNICQMTRFEIEREIKNISKEIEEREDTIKNCNAGKCIYKGINDTTNLSRLEDEIENLKNESSGLEDILRKLNDVQHVFTPEELKRKWAEVKDDVNRSMEVVPRETLVEILGEEDYDTLKRIVNEWLPAIEKLKLPTLVDAIKTKKVDSLPLSKSLNLDHMTNIMQKMSIRNIDFEVLSRIKSEIETSGREKLTLRCDESDEDLDYEFVSNPYVYAYLRYLISQNEATNEEYIRNVFEEACGNKLISKEQRQSVSFSEHEDVDIGDEKEQNSLPSNNFALDAVSLPDDSSDSSETNEVADDTSNTENNLVTLSSNKNTIEEAIASLKGDSNLDEISNEEIVERISTIGSIEQNLLLSYLINFFPYTGKESILLFLISSGVPENYAERFNSVWVTKFKIRNRKDICLVFGGDVTIEIKKNFPDCFELNIQTKKKEIQSSELKVGSFLFNAINDKDNWKVMLDADTNNKHQ